MIGTAAFLLASPPARAAPASTLRQEGVSLKLVVLAPDPSGRVRGALQIDLDPGWKTYWIAPGPVGLAPHLDFGGSRGIGTPAVFYPVPHRFQEGTDVSVGYDGPTAFAFEAQVNGDAAPTVRLDLLIGVCREICIPVSGQLETSPESGLTAKAAVSSAFSSLPVEAPAPAGWHARLSGDGTTLRIAMPIADAGVRADLYVAGPNGWSFGEPVRRDDGAGTGRPAFDVPVAARPTAPAGGLDVDVLLTSGESARLSRSLDVELP